jgi:hypothetical protein
MIFKKDNFLFGCILGLLAPFIGFIFFRYRNLSPLSYLEALEFIYQQSGHLLLTAAMSVSLLANATLFTICINAHIDKTAKGIFAVTLVYSLLTLAIKLFG